MTVNKHPKPVVEQTIRLLNSAAAPLCLTLEPWAEQYIVPSGTAVDVTAHGPSGGKLEISVEDDGIIVYGWTGSTVDVVQDGDAVTPMAPQRASS
ncbi:MAG: hypothetical protein ACRDJE_19020 [Dehalococcoidia bacterium]